MNEETLALPQFLSQVIAERNLSNRAFAMYVGVSEGTIRRLLAGEKADFETLQRIASYLNYPLESLYRMAGILPEEDLKTLAVREAEHLLKQLPPEKQREVLEMIRAIHRLYAEQSAQTSELEETQETG